LCLTPLLKIFQLYRGSKFYWWGKLYYPEKTTDLPQVTDNIYLSLNVTAEIFLKVALSTITMAMHIDKVTDISISMYEVDLAVSVLFFIMKYFFF
jgi:hypothetical protein